MSVGGTLLFAFACDSLKELCDYLQRLLQFCWQASKLVTVPDLRCDSRSSLIGNFAVEVWYSNHK